MAEAEVQAELIRLSGWIDYLNQEREIQMAKIEDLHAMIAKISEAAMAQTADAARALSEERQKHQAQIDSAVVAMSELYEKLVPAPVDQDGDEPAHDQTDEFAAQP